MTDTKNSAVNPAEWTARQRLENGIQGRESWEVVEVSVANLRDLLNRLACDDSGLPTLPAPNYRKLSKGTLFENCWTADQMHAYARAAIAAAAPAGEPVGEAGTMPGTSGFTMACFKAVDVPVGTKLYAAPVPAAAPVKCEMCNGHGMVGCMTPEGGEGWPCPDCEAREAAAAPKAALTLGKINELAAKHIKDVCGIERKPEPMGEDHEFIIMCRAIEAASGPNAALVEALQYALLHLRGEEADTDGAERKIRAALAAAGVKP